MVSHQVETLKHTQDLIGHSNREALGDRGSSIEDFRGRSIRWLVTRGRHSSIPRLTIIGGISKTRGTALNLAAVNSISWEE